MKQYTIYQIDAFTKEKFKGNPAGVVVNADGLSENEMQTIARELNNSETAFLFRPDDNNCDGIIIARTKTHISAPGYVNFTEKKFFSSVNNSYSLFK